jgi:hypothetical protein
VSLTFSNAITIAQMELNKVQRFGNVYILLPEEATETTYGWLIPWVQSDYLSTKEVTVGGNAPFFLDRFSGAVCHAHCRADFDGWLKGYARQHGYIN